MCHNTWVNYTTDFLIAEQVGREGIIFCLTIHHPPFRRAAGTVGYTDTSDSLHQGLSARYRSQSEFVIDYINHREGGGQIRIQARIACIIIHSDFL